MEYHGSPSASVYSFFSPATIMVHQFRHYLLTWIAHHRSKPSVAKRKRKNKDRISQLVLSSA
jgi:hypothetical protein